MNTRQIEHDAVMHFIDRILEDYEMDRSELIGMWNTLPYAQRHEQEELPAIKGILYDRPQLKTKKVKELKQICKELQLKTTGTKPDLIDRILASGMRIDQHPIIDILTAQQKHIRIHQNAFGYYEHVETGFVFDPSTQQVIGVQQPTGELKTLTLKDIDACKEYQFTYRVPPNLAVDE